MKDERETAGRDDTCEKIKSNGERCHAMAMIGTKYCFFHNPATENARKAAQRQGGRANGGGVLPDDAANVPLRKAKDVSLLLECTINQVRKGQVSPKVADSIGYLSGVWMKALEAADLDERLAKVEQALKARGTDDQLFNPDDDGGHVDGSGSKANR